MTKTTGHLWAIGYDDVGRAAQVRQEITSLGWVKRGLILEDVAVAVRQPDGSFTVDREPFPVEANVLGCTVAGLLAGLVLGVPLAGAAVGAVIGGAGTAASAAVGIGEDFIREVKAMMKPGTSALFVLDSERNLDATLHAIRGLGGTVLKTNVDVERARLIQSTLAATPAQPSIPDRK
jgi:uncharacterized membrane protein